MTGKCCHLVCSVGVLFLVMVLIGCQSTNRVKIQVDCIVLEVQGQLELDWETFVKAKNILDEPVSLDEKPGHTMAADLLGTVTDKGVAGSKLDAFIELFASRGYLSIVTKPSVCVSDGQRGQLTARDDSAQSTASGSCRETSLEVTPQILENGNIKLEATISLNSTITMKSGQEPIVSVRQVESNVCIRPGESQLVGGTTQGGKGHASRKIITESNEPTKETLFILTANVIKAKPT